MIVWKLDNVFAFLNTRKKVSALMHVQLDDFSRIISVVISYCQDIKLKYQKLPDSDRFEYINIQHFVQELNSNQKG